MTDSIWGSRFIQRGTEPAWHHKGFQIGRQNMTAEEMLRFVGTYEVALEQLYVKTLIRVPNRVPLDNSSLNPPQDAYYTKEAYLPVPYSQIVRAPTKDDPVPRIFGSPVSSAYELIGPLEACRIWDNALTTAHPSSTNSRNQVPTETLGVLKDGREIFMSAKIGTMDIKGDQVDQYIVLDSPMYSNNAAVCVTTLVRPVCQNTLTLGINQATSKMIIPHIAGARERVYEWLHSTFLKSKVVIAEASADLTRMASFSVRSAAASALLLQIYPDPPVPSHEWSFGISYEEHLVRYDEKLTKIKEVRQTIMDLFGGDGFGQDTVAAQGTLFGLYNAIAELEDNRKGTGESRALGVTVGDRAAVVRRAYVRIMDYISNTPSQN